MRESNIRRKPEKSKNILVKKGLSTRSGKDERLLGGGKKGVQRERQRGERSVANPEGDRLCHYG